MEHYTLYDFHEVIALITSTLIGTGAYLGFLILKKQKKIGFSFMFWTFAINLMFTYVGSEVLSRLNWGEYRTIALPLVAYLGQYFADWLDTRYPKLFDAGAKKAGLDLDNDKPKYRDYETEDYDDRDNY